MSVTINQDYINKGYKTLMMIVAENPHITKGIIQRHRLNAGKGFGFEEGRVFYYSTKEVEEILREHPAESYGMWHAPSGYYSYEEVEAQLGCCHTFVKSASKKYNLGTFIGKRKVFTAEDIEIMRSHYHKPQEHKTGGHQKKIPEGYKPIKEVSGLTNIADFRIRVLCRDYNIGSRVGGVLVFNELDIERLKTVGEKYHRDENTKYLQRTYSKEPSAINKRISVKLKPSKVYKNFWKISIWSDELFAFVVKKCCLSKKDALSIEQSLTALGIVCHATPHARYLQGGKVW